ncbi:MAG: T9SS type A sorting domain-containing protein, partial [Bacteroidales bacterium]|nr:T9SS type A sorting domain-containing protein [Bacteroidales bacterium]
NYEISNLEIYPNPAQDMLNISFNANGNKNVNCQVVNVAGSVVYRNSFSGNENQSVQIDVSNLPVGVYFVNFKYDKGTITKKVVIE